MYQIVLSVQLDKRRGFPHKLHPSSSSLTNKFSSTTLHPAIGNLRVDKTTYGLSFPLLLNFLFFLSNKFLAVSLNDRFMKRPFLFVASLSARKTPCLPCCKFDPIPPYAQYNTEESHLKLTFGYYLTIFVYPCRRGPTIDKSQPSAI